MKKLKVVSLTLLTVLLVELFSALSLPTIANAAGEITEDIDYAFVSSSDDYVLALSIILSVIASVLIAARINNPLQKVIESIRGMNEGGPFRSTIREFNIISDQLDKKKRISSSLFSTS